MGWARVFGTGVREDRGGRGLSGATVEGHVLLDRRRLHSFRRRRSLRHHASAVCCASAADLH